MGRIRFIVAIIGHTVSRLGTTPKLHYSALRGVGVIFGGDVMFCPIFTTTKSATPCSG